MKRIPVVLGIAVVMAFAATANAQFIYQVDDGSVENNIGVTNGSILWGNMFAVDSMGAILNDFSVGFGVDTVTGSLVGNDVTWSVFNDDDGDATAGLTLLASGMHTIQNDDFGTNGVLDTIDLGGLNVSNDDFVFIALGYTDLTGGGFPAAIDTTASQLQSWAAVSADNTQGGWAGGNLIDNFGFAGNWIIRAKGRAIPEPSAFALITLLSGLAVARRRR